MCLLGTNCKTVVISYLWSKIMPVGFGSRRQCMMKATHVCLDKGLLTNCITQFNLFHTILCTFYFVWQISTSESKYNTHWGVSPAKHGQRQCQFYAGPPLDQHALFWRRWCVFCRSWWGTFTSETLVKALLDAAWKIIWISSSCL